MHWDKPQAGRAPSPARLEAWEKLEGPAFALLPYLMLVIASGLEIALSGLTADTLVTLGIAAFAGAWMLGGFTLHPAWRDRPRWMAVFFAVLVLAMAALVIRAPLYGFFTFTGYFFTFWLPFGWPRMLGVAAVGLTSATSQNGGLPQHTAGAIAVYAGLIFVNTVIAGAILWFTYVGSEQNDRRKETMDQLSEANRRLQATLEENAGLHEQLLAQAREAGVYDERQRMAREIHDTLAQSLAGIITQLQAAEQAARDAERRRHRDAALQLARDGLTEARRSVHELRPEPLEGGRIGDALTSVAQRWSALHRIEAVVMATGPSRPMPSETELVLLRIGQEALANVAKHAAARRVVLTLSYIGDQVTLDIRDDGTGFDPAVVAAGEPGPGGGFGLTAMRQRAEGVAGTLAIESEPGAGTTISVSLPLQAAGSGPAAPPAGARAADVPAAGVPAARAPAARAPAAGAPAAGDPAPGSGAGAPVPAESLTGAPAACVPDTGAPVPAPADSAPPETPGKRAWPSLSSAPRAARGNR
jgi:signal transduction histidine kinase